LHKHHSFHYIDLQRSILVLPPADGTEIGESNYTRE